MTIRSKLTMTAVVVTVLANSLLLLVAVQYMEHVWMNEVQTQVALDLNSARAAYRGHIGMIDAFLRAMALEPTLASAVDRRDRAEIQVFLDRGHRSQGMDFLSLVDPGGKVVCRAHNADRRGDDLSANLIIARALERKQPASGTIVLSAEELAVEGGNLAERARVALVDTAAARPTADAVRSDGMVVAAAVPVFDARGRLAAVLYAGDLLSRRYDIVDGIRRQVFLNTAYEGQDIGTVAISQGDLRIATTFALEDGSRAVGTRLSAAVGDEVLGRGRTWTARAFVINDWYFTAYEPIRDPAGQVVGVLSVGLLQAPFVHQQQVITGVLLAIVMTATAASLTLDLPRHQCRAPPHRRRRRHVEESDRRQYVRARGHPTEGGNGRALPSRRRHGRRAGRARGTAQTGHQPATRAQREAGFGRSAGGRRGA